MVYNTMNSAILIAEIFDRYNIKSNDFIQRCPNWIDSCLDEIKSKRTLAPFILNTRFVNNRVQLPKFTKSVDWVVIDEVKAHYNESLYVLDNDVDLNRNAVFSGNISDQTPKFGQLISIDNDTEKDPDFADLTIPRFYRTSNGWIHTNVKFGNIEAKCNVTPFTLDDLTGLEFPIIPDDVNLKEAIMWYILRTLLMRGYVHPYLKLDSPNPETNPAIAFRKYATLARISLNSPNMDERKKYTYPMASIFGVRPTYHVDKVEKIIVPKVEEQWVSDGEPYCEFVDSNNTGILLIPEKKQQLISNVWVDTLITRTRREENSIMCPIRSLRGGYATGDDVFSNPTYFAILNDSPIGVQIEPIDDYKYLYIVVPTIRKFSVFNDISLNITSEFEKVGVDNSDLFVNCDVYRTRNKFYFGIGFEFAIQYSI